MLETFAFLKINPNLINILELITILLLITLSLSWIQDYPYQITISTDNRLSQTDKRLSVLDNNIKYIIFVGASLNGFDCLAILLDQGTAFYNVQTIAIQGSLEHMNFPSCNSRIWLNF